MLMTGFTKVVLIGYLETSFLTQIKICTITLVQSTRDKIYGKLIFN